MEPRSFPSNRPQRETAIIITQHNRSVKNDSRGTSVKLDSWDWFTYFKMKHTQEFLLKGLLQLAFGIIQIQLHRGATAFPFMLMWRQAYP